MKIGRGITNHLYVDVDGTLLLWPGARPGSALVGATPKVNTALVEQVLKWREKSGGTIVIWSMGGTAHAERAARLCGIEGAVCIAKPDLAIDDADALWFEKKFVQVKPELFRV